MNSKVTASQVGKIAKAANPQRYAQGKVTNLVGGRGAFGITTETVWGQVQVIWNGNYAGEVKPIAGQPGAAEYWANVEAEMAPIREALIEAGYTVEGSVNLTVK